MTFWPLTNSDFSTDQTFHQFNDLDIELDLQRAFATGVACQQGTLTLLDTWFRPPFWDLLVLQLLWPDSNLPCLYSTFHLKYPRYFQFTMFFRYRRHRDVDNIVSISCKHRYLVIPRLHLRHRDVDDIVSISCQHRYPVIGGLPYLVYIVHIVDIAMLTISYRHFVDIGTLLYLVYIVNIVDIVMLTISCRYRV